MNPFFKTIANVIENDKITKPLLNFGRLIKIMKNIRSGMIE